MKKYSLLIQQYKHQDAKLAFVDETNGSLQDANCCSIECDCCDSINDFYDNLCDCSCCSCDCDSCDLCDSLDDCACCACERHLCESCCSCYENCEDCCY